MEKLSYRWVYNRKHRLNSRGEALVQVEAYGRGRKAYFGTHIYLKPLQWDVRRQRIRRHPHAATLNMQLRQYVSKLEGKELALRLRGTPVTPALLKEAMRQSESVPAFYAFVERMIAQTSHREGTRRNRLTTLHALHAFRSAVEWSDVSVAFVHDFEHHLRLRGEQVSTVAKHLKHLRLFVNLAIRHGLLPEDASPFRTYSIPKARHTPVYLTEEELRRMEALATADCPAAHRPTLEAYLFCCYTGLRYSDFTALTADNLTCEGGVTWLQFTTVKTGVAVRLPLDHLFEGKALELLRRHAGRIEELCRLKSDGAVNRSLRALAALAGIRKHLTFHTARHTFATLLIYKGAHLTTVQKLLGHRRVTTTEHYATVLPEGIVKDLLQCTH
jgi:site-specific recombinase XerD